MILFLILSCEEETFDNPVDPDTELSPDDWAPTSLTIEILTDSDVKLSWQKSEIEATGFKVERQDTVGGVFVEVGTIDTTIYTDTGLIVGNEYMYQVCAYSGDNQSSYATSDTIVTTFPAPYEMSAVPDTNSMIILAWSDSTAYESGFVIERKNITSDAFTVLDSTAQNTYQDTTVTLGNEYLYKVNAYSDYNTSSYTYAPSVPYWQDCSDTWGGIDEEDNCGICDINPYNDNTPLTGTCDCNAEPNGTAALDNCGVCDGDNTPLTGTCDCNAVSNGTAVLDNCGVCDGDNSPLTGSCDCHSTPNGEAYTDGCGDCVGGLTGEEACANDCLGELGGDAVNDNCNTCDNDPENDCLQDCSGTWGGDLVDDDCGICDGDNSSCQDDCGVVNGDNTCQILGSLPGPGAECNESWSGSNWDECGVCDGDNAPNTGTCDCASTPNGTAVEDCADVCNGSAYIDNCDICVGGTTGETACVQDCEGTWGGDLVDDECGVCDGDGTSCDYSLSFDGEDDYVIMNNSIPVETFTYAVSLFPYNLSNAHVTILNNGDNSGGCRIRLTSSGRIQIVKNNIVTFGESTESIVFNAWNHILVSYDLSGNVDFYINGSLSNSINSIQTFDYNEPFLIAAEPHLTTSELFDGKINDVALWNTSFGSELALGLSNGTILPSGYYGANLVGYWKFNAGDGTTLYDHSGNGNHGTIYGATWVENAVDCAGVVGGSAITDNCGDCVGGDTGADACVQDCNGDWGGSAVEDCAGNCGGPNWINNCGDCTLGNPELDDTQFDNCGTCDSDSSNDCVQDCNNEWGGTATTDNCGDCVGGDTGADACVQDDCGVWGGDNSTCINFTEHVISTNADGASSVFPIDLDGDGDIDILAATWTGYTVDWYENDGSGNFTLNTIFTHCSGVYYVTALDIDEDGDIDILSGAAGRISLHKNDGSQNFTTIDVHVELHPTWGECTNHSLQVHDLFAADIDGDNDIDIASLNSRLDNVMWYENDGSEVFTDHTIHTYSLPLGETSKGIHGVDLDTDGDIDILIAGGQNQVSHWFENDGYGNFTPNVISTTDSPRSIHAADLDNDGDIDVIQADSYGPIFIFENDGSETFSYSSISTDDTPWSLHTSDIDDDGKIDILAAISDYDIVWYENETTEGLSAQSFTKHTVYDNAYYPLQVHAADIDGDGDMDILSASYNDNKIAWHENSKY